MIRLKYNDDSGVNKQVQVIISTVANASFVSMDQTYGPGDVTTSNTTPDKIDYNISIKKMYNPAPTTVQNMIVDEDNEDRFKLITVVDVPVAFKTFVLYADTQAGKFLLIEDLSALPNGIKGVVNVAGMYVGHYVGNKDYQSVIKPIIPVKDIVKRGDLKTDMIDNAVFIFRDTSREGNVFSNNFGYNVDDGYYLESDTDKVAMYISVGASSRLFTDANVSVLVKTAVSKVSNGYMAYTMAPDDLLIPLLLV